MSHGWPRIPIFLASCRGTTSAPTPPTAFLMTPDGECHRVVGRSVRSSHRSSEAQSQNTRSRQPPKPPQAAKEVDGKVFGLGRSASFDPDDTVRNSLLRVTV
eukprot:scaffold564536_cov42-Prasinocladus_malaysianus.AAC.1